jgi:hypothetical protein
MDLKEVKVSKRKVRYYLTICLLRYYEEVNYHFKFTHLTNQHFSAGTKKLDQI